jgi:hypothetical protein
LRYSVNVRLPETAYDALVDVAERELRDPRSQAAKFVLDGLKRSRAVRESAGDSPHRADQAALSGHK